MKIHIGQRWLRYRLVAVTGAAAAAAAAGDTAKTCCFEPMLRK